MKSPTRSAADAAPQIRQPPNYVLKQPLRERTEWSSTWQSNQFGSIALIPISKRITESGRTHTLGTRQFNGCLRLEISGSGSVSAPNGPTAIEVTGEEWYCEDIGFVQGTFKENLPEFPTNATVIALELTDHNFR